MKIDITKELIKVENTHDLLRRSFLRFVARKKRSIFTYHDADISESEFDAAIHVTYDSSIHKIKDIKPIVSDLKKKWLASDAFQQTGFAKSQLLARGWTAASIKSFLGECDCEVTNPHYRSGAPMMIFHVDRVIKTENSAEWQSWYENSLSKRAKLQESSLERAHKSRMTLLKQVNSQRLNLPTFSLSKLFAKSVHHYNRLAEDRGKEFVEVGSCSKDFLHRISVNYLRHCFNDYERRLERMSGLVGNQEAYILFKSRILAQISEQYPSLKTEVSNQQLRLDEYHLKDLFRQVRHI